MKLNEKELTNLKRLSDTVYGGCQCKNCPYNLSDTCIKNYDANYCEIVLGKRLALYEDIGRDILDIPEDECIPLEVLETSFKIGVVLTVVSKHNKTAKVIYNSVVATIDKVLGEKKDGEINDET